MCIAQRALFFWFSLVRVIKDYAYTTIASGSTVIRPQELDFDFTGSKRWRSPAFRGNLALVRPIVLYLYVVLSDIRHHVKVPMLEAPGRME